MQSPALLKNNKSSPAILSVLNCPSKSHLSQIHSSSPQYSLLFYAHKKQMLAAYKIIIQKSKLYPNFEIYQWRSQTEFPIVKTYFVSVKQTDTVPNQTVEITAYTEHCPLKLSQIFDMTISQSLYVLKEALIGFERLYNRFGSFQILNSMITINQKGFCRVWLNQNFGLNLIPKTDLSERQMVNKIITIVESHSQDSKSIKKFFFSLKNCQSFLTALKGIEQFIKETKSFVCSKFIAISSTKDIPKIDYSGNAKLKNLEQPISYSRFSIKQEKKSIFRQTIKDQLKNSQRNRKTSLSPCNIKKQILKNEKSTQDIFTFDKIMKVSDQQTAHTGKKVPKTQQENCLSPSTKQNEKQPKKRSGWIQQLSYIMGDQESSQDVQKKKKQMSQSQAFSGGHNFFNDSSRKYSCKISSSPQYTSPQKNHLNNIFLTKQNSNISSGSPEQKPIFRSQRERKANNNRIQEVDEDKFRQEVSGNVLKNNGWIPTVSGLLDIPVNLQQSYHEGQQQAPVNQNIQLERLNKVGRREMLTSILNEQFEELL